MFVTITLDGEPKEIADLAGEMQDRLIQTHDYNWAAETAAKAGIMALTLGQDDPTPDAQDVELRAGRR